MRIAFNIPTAVFAAVLVSVPAFAAGSQLSAETLFQPHFWVASIAALGFIGLSLGDGIGHASAERRERREDGGFEGLAA